MKNFNWKRWSKEEENILIENYNKVRNIELYRLLDRSPIAIQVRASKLGLSKITSNLCQNKISVLLNETPETYYWIGFILADGHISITNQLVLSLSIKDLNHLHKFSNYIESKSVKIRHDICTVTARDNYNIKQLKDKFYIRTDKTYYPPKLDQIKSDKLFLSLFAGYVDGDGSIGIYKGKTGSLRFGVHSSWLPILQLIKLRLEQIFKIKLSVPYINGRGYACWSIDNFSILKKLKRFNQKCKLPTLNRKWDKIDLDYITQSELATIRLLKATKMKKIGYSIKEISTELNMTDKGVYRLFKRNSVY